MRRIAALIARTLGALLLVGVCLGVSVLVGAGVSGHDGRGYATVDADATVTVSGTEESAMALAKRYQPLTLVDPDRSTPPLEWMYVEVVDDEDAYVLLYHRVWADERHPHALVNAAYRVWRSLYYGYPSRDIERTLIAVSKESGDIVRVVFEDADAQPYDAPAPAHRALTITRLDDGTYASSTGTVITLPVDGTRLRQGNATWNHLSVLAMPDDPTYTKPLDAELRELTNELYYDGKFARKGPAGGYDTSENTDVRWAATLVTLAATLLGALAWQQARGRRRLELP